MGAQLLDNFHFRWNFLIKFIAGDNEALKHKSPLIEIHLTNFKIIGNTKNPRLDTAKLKSVALTGFKPH